MLAFLRPHRPKRFLTLVAVAIALLLTLAACSREVTVIGVLEVDLSDAMVETRTGFLAVLRESGFQAADDIRLVRRSVEVRDQPLDELMEELLEDEEAVMVLALTTPALGAALGATTDIPILFAMSGDPFAAGAGQSRAAHRANVTGAQALAPDVLTMELLTRALPDVSVVGILFVPEATDSAASAARAKAAAEERGLTAVLGAASGPPTRVAMEALVDAGAGAIYVTPSELLVGEFSDILAVADAANVPVFATRADLSKQGALAAFEIEWESHGRRVGLLAAKVLRGEDISSLPIAVETDYALTFNREVAERFGVDFDDPALLAGRGS